MLRHTQVHWEVSPEPTKAPSHSNEFEILRAVGSLNIGRRAALPWGSEKLQLLAFSVVKVGGFCLILDRFSGRNPFFTQDLDFWMVSSTNLRQSLGNSTLNVEKTSHWKGSNS